MPPDVAALGILVYPDPRLRQICEPVERVDDEIRALAARMMELMHEAKGIGLAAPQVGVLRRVFVCNTTGKLGGDRVFVNPRLVDLEGSAFAEEGCLSLPDVTVNVGRAVNCRIIARDLNGREVEMRGNDLDARCWQHEVDHLNGRLILDYMSEADKLANRKALKRLKAPAR